VLGVGPRAVLEQIAEEGVHGTVGDRAMGVRVAGQC